MNFDASTDELLARWSNGDRDAVQLLLARHRSRLRKMIDVRMDNRIVARVDPSDVVQETLMEAARRLSEYVRNRPLAFYPWLRQIARERLDKISRFHVAAEKRTVRRERPAYHDHDRSSVILANYLVHSGTNPSGQAIKREQKAVVLQALAKISEIDREILTLRHAEQLSMAEVAAVIGLSESATKSRHYRALSRFQALLNKE